MTTFTIVPKQRCTSKLVERIERGERITIARNNRPVVLLSPVAATAQEILGRIDAVRERIRERNGARAILGPAETWQNLIEEGRRVLMSLVVDASTTLAAALPDREFRFRVCGARGCARRHSRGPGPGSTSCKMAWLCYGAP